jgi:hypothetical protein
MQLMIDDQCHVATWHIKFFLVNQFYYQFLMSLIYTHGQIVLCHVTTFMIFETFRIKIGG